LIDVHVRNLRRRSRTIPQHPACNILAVPASATGLPRPAAGESQELPADGGLHDYIVAHHDADRQVPGAELIAETQALAR